MTFPFILALPAILAFTVWDLRLRRLPNWLTLTFATGALLARQDAGAALGGAIVGMVVCRLAGYPWGDVKGCGALGAFLGPVAVAELLLGPLLVTALAWRLGYTGVPFFGYVAPAFALLCWWHWWL